MIKTIEPKPTIDRYEHTPPVGITWHPYADIFPWLEGAAREELKADIEKNGVLEPIVFLDGAILDGRNRYEIARELGIEYPLVEYVGDDPLGFVLSKNLSRRHLTDRQRADVAAKLAKLPRGRPSENPSIDGITATEAAKIMDVPVKAVERSKAIQENAAPELKAAYESGEVSQSAAAEVAKLPPAVQKQIVSDGKTAAAAKELREKRAAERKAAQDQNDASRESVRSALPAFVAEQEKFKAAATAAKATKNDNAFSDADRIAELEETVHALESEIGALRSENKLYGEMKIQFAKGGFEQIIAAKNEEIRVLQTRVASESQEKVKNLRSMEFWKKKAVELGYSSREVIDLDA